MGQIIIAMSGRKQAGKSTLANYIRNLYAEKMGLDGIQEHTAEFSFADDLKEFCVNVLGLPYESCYGTDEQKNSPTQYEWSNVPRFLAWKFRDPIAKSLIRQGKNDDQLMKVFAGLSSHVYAEGKMTGREVMQVLGTDLIRHTFGNVWAAATMRRIKKSGVPFSVIPDNRFQNEISHVLAEQGGHIIRLTRSPYGSDDVHSSESALDNFDWNTDKCFVLDNQHMTLKEQSVAIRPIIDQILRGRC